MAGTPAGTARRTASPVAATDADALPDGRQLDASRFYADLPAAAEAALKAAGQAWQDDAEALLQIDRAEREAPGHIAVAIARYRRAFYKHCYEEALGYAELCLAHVARRRNFPTDWRLVRCGDADFASGDGDLRFWLYGLQAYGYILIRLGRLEDGLAALDAVLAVDPADQTRTGMIRDLATRQAQGDDDD